MEFDQAVRHHLECPASGTGWRLGTREHRHMRDHTGIHFERLPRAWLFLQEGYNIMARALLILFPHGVDGLATDA